ncbi:MAG: dihydrofolate reductase [Bacteroidaceae bacterium]|nr:dihydrofolate reductase [Bacteroidaceae bacterium]
MLTIIAALDRRGAIGFQNKLLFRLPDDLKRFKSLTTGHTVLMGRNTYDSLPHGALPNRRNIVLSRTINALPSCEVFPSLSQALAACQPDEQVFAIGGATVYQAALPLADRMILTHVEAEAPEADTFFPTIDSEQWRVVSREAHAADERHAVPFSFVHYTRL